MPDQIAPTGGIWSPPCNVRLTYTLRSLEAHKMLFQRNWITFQGWRPGKTCRNCPVCDSSRVTEGKSLYGDCFRLCLSCNQIVPCFNSSTNHPGAQLYFSQFLALPPRFSEWVDGLRPQKRFLARYATLWARIIRFVVCVRYCSWAKYSGGLATANTVFRRIRPKSWICGKIECLPWEITYCYLRLFLNLHC